MNFYFLTTLTFLVICISQVLRSVDESIIPSQLFQNSFVNVAGIYLGSDVISITVDGMISVGGNRKLQQITLIGHATISYTISTSLDSDRLVSKLNEMTSSDSLIEGLRQNKCLIRSAD